MSLHLKYKKSLLPSGSNLRIIAMLLVFSVAFITSLALDTKNAQAASTAPRYATASSDCVNTTGVGTVAWSTPGNAFSATDSQASATAALGRNITSNYLRCSNFGFTTADIPTGSTIQGISVTINRKVSTTNATTTDNAVQLLKGGTLVAANKASASAWPTTFATAVYGGTTDLWGTSFALADVTASNFGVSLSAIHGGTTNSSFTYSVDYISVTIAYEPPPWTSITQRQGVITNDQNNTVLSSHTAKVGERLRVITQVDTNTGGAKNRVFKLQYDKNDNTWVDVKPGGEIRPAKSTIIGLESDVGTGIAGTCTGGVTKGKGFMYEDTAKTDFISITGLGCHDIGFVVDTANATENTTYRFRLYDMTGAAALNTYSAYASFTTVASGSNTTKASKSNTTSLATSQADLKSLLDNQGYSNVNTDDAAREILQNVSSDTTEDVTITGEATSSSLGSSVSGGGDVNGDGYDDMVVGSPGYSSSTGRAYIYYGGPLMDSTPDVTMTGEATSNNFGTSVAMLGDVNGDGLADIVVGADGYSTNTGRAYVYFGGTAMDNTADLTMTGAGTNNYYGQSVAAAGDVNGDSFRDVVVGAAVQSASEAKAYVYYGGSSIDSTADVTTSYIDTTPLRVVVAGGGDNNGDGYADIVMVHVNTSSFNSRARVYFGSASMDSTEEATITLSGGDARGLLNNFDYNNDGYDDLFFGMIRFGTNTGRVAIYNSGITIDTTVDNFIDGVAQNINLGRSLVNAGDTNGDGYEDLLVTADGYDVGTGTNEGRSYIYQGGATLDLLTPDVTITGSAANNLYGSSAAAIGDVNGDGFDDIAVGANGYSTNTGQVYIYYQSQTINNTADKTLQGLAPSSYFGVSVDTSGDVNGDGYDDTVVGAYVYGTSTGRVYVYYGGPGMDTTADVTLIGEATNNYFGASVSSGGDINGDGYDDVVVGAYQYSTYTGRAYVYYGGASMDSTADVIMTGEGTNNYFGYSVSSGGDINGDGYDDVVVGAWAYSSSSGRVYVYYGGASMDTTADVTITGAGSSYGLGFTVTSDGDINGDGYDDVVAAARVYSTWTGRVYVFYGGSSMDTTADLTLTGEATNNFYGEGLASGGDINGDGYDDVVVGAKGYSTSTGRVYVYYGGPGLDTTADIILDGATTSNSFGISVASEGDLNSDGYNDLLVGASGYSTDTGRAYVYYGGSSMDTTADLTMTGEATSNYFGTSVSSGGDINGDGYPEAVVGALGYSSFNGRTYVYFGGSSAYQPVFNLAQKHSSACSGLSSIIGSWKGQSSVIASTNNLALQIYRFGSTNAWETAVTESSLAANTDGTISGYVSASLSEYCDGSNWSYWRLSQASGTQTLQTNAFSIDFSNSAPPSAPTSLAQNKVTGGTTIATGGWTNENQVILSASATDPDVSDTLQLCVESKPIASAFTGTGEVCGTGVAYSGSAVTPTATLTGITENEYHWRARVKDAGGMYSSWVSYDVNAESARDYGVDTSVPTGTVYDGSSVGVDASFNNGSLTGLSANWTSTTTISGLSGYEYSIGTTAGGTDKLGWTSASTSTSASPGSLSLVTSQTYYFNVRITDNAGNTAIISSNGVLVAPSLSFTTSSNSVNFGALNAGNTTASQNITLTTTTNAQNGYQVFGKATDVLKNQSLQTLAMFSGGSYSSPAAWGSSTGFGYNSSDTSVGGSNRFNSTTCLGGGSAPCFAPYSLIGMGEVVADSSAPSTSGTATTITNKVTIDSTTQRAGRYQTTILYSAYATY